MDYNFHMMKLLFKFDFISRFANHMKRQHQQDLSEEELANIFAKNTGKIVHFKNPVSCKK